MTGHRSTAASLLYVLSFYSILVWCYLAGNALVHPETLDRRLTHFAPWPSEGTTAVVCFVVSALAFFGARLLGGRSTDGRG